MICDVNEYRKCVNKLRSPLVTTLFDTLHGLCNLLLVKPENLRQVCTGDTLVSALGSIPFCRKTLGPPIGKVLAPHSRDHRFIPPVKL